MKIISLTASNIKRLKAVEIHPDGTLQVITGRNAQGKSSVLDAIWLALGGGAAARETSRPIRDGETTASVTLDLGDIVVTRTWTGDKTTLQVKSADGARYSSPQSMLDSLVGRLSFDPLAFTHQSPREQVASLLAIVDLGIDLDAMARERQRLYDSRADVGRSRKQLGTIPTPDAGVPDREVSVSVLVAQAREAARINGDISQYRSEAVSLAATIRRLEGELSQARESLRRVEGWVEAHEVVDTAAIDAQIEQAEGTNRAVRRNAELRKQAGYAASLDAEYSDLSDKIAGLDGRKADALSSSTFPVEGLGFDDQGVTYHGIPFAQASSAEQIRVSLAMAMALNPKLRVIRIMDGSLLDSESMTAIADMAKTSDYQVWVERVEDSSSAAVVIEDGEVA